MMLSPGRPARSAAGVELPA